MFCTFVSFLRYVKINEINYLFPQYDKDEKCIVLPLVKDIDIDIEKFNFKTSSIKIDFIDKIDSAYKNTTWYDEFVKAMILTKYE